MQRQNAPFRALTFIAVNGFIQSRCHKKRLLLFFFYSILFRPGLPRPPHRSPLPLEDRCPTHHHRRRYCCCHQPWRRRCPWKRPSARRKLFKKTKPQKKKCIRGSSGRGWLIDADVVSLCKIETTGSDSWGLSRFIPPPPTTR